MTGLAGFDSLALQQDERFVMPWNETDREKYAVIRQRYASDLSDAEFALLEPLLPARKACGRKPTDAITAFLTTVRGRVSARERDG